MPMNEGQGARMEVAFVLVGPLSCPLLAVTWTVVRSRRCLRDDALLAVAVGTLTLRNRLRGVLCWREVMSMEEKEELIRC